ncbi:phosphoethanolamine transferase [Alteromonas sp. AMM-1]|uniref:phosphoethanolamine transferase n=1 Tax=Alteromonas sp. AMM-1 TaxID=3394233 RepID=UPI0039A6709E
MFATLSKKRRFTNSQLLVITSVFFTVVVNFPFLKAVYLASSPSTIGDWLFLLSVPVLLCSLLLIFFTLSGALFFTKTVLAIHIIVSSLLLYGTLVYGTLFDTSMIQNVVETDSGEALSYLNMSLVIFFIGLGLLPVFAIFTQQIKGAFTTNIKMLLKVNLLAMLAIAVIATTLYKDYAAIGRNNKGLIKFVTPLAFYDSGYKFLRDTYLYPPLPYRILDSHPAIAEKANNTPVTLIVVVGETARADKFSLNGYARNTNPRLEALDVVSFQNVDSCGTATAISVPCMFSRLGREKYNSRLASSQDNALDIIHRAGYHVEWIDNNSSCKGVCTRIPNTPYDPNRNSQFCDGRYCKDEILLTQLSQALAAHSNKKPRVIVLHTIGSHGPTYYQRYPDPYRQFIPDCPRSDIQNCDLQQLTNTYDNTILYADFILSSVIEQLKNIPNSALLYISDHGESLGEKGLYLHGFPYSIAPSEQTHVPLIYWSQGLEDASYRECVSEQAGKSLSHDNIYDTLLGLTAVNSTTYQPEMDVFSICR